MNQGVADLCRLWDIPVPPASTGYVPLLPIVEAACDRGFVCVLKWDGERDPDAGDNGGCTVIISGGPLTGSDTFFRIDAATMETALVSVLSSLGDWVSKRG